MTKNGNALTMFEDLVASHTPDLQNLSPENGVGLMVQFYQNTRFDDCLLEEDGDMLLVQWGTYDWGEGRHFEFDITRQLVPDETDPPICQLSLTFRYLPSDEFTLIGSTNRWLNEPTTEAIKDFKAFIFESDAFKAVSIREPVSIKIDYDDAE